MAEQKTQTLQYWREELARLKALPVALFINPEAMEIHQEMIAKAEHMVALWEGDTEKV